jgi:hypothetical protein
MTSRARLLALLTLPLLALAVPTPAHAASGGTTSTGDVVLYDECQQHPITFTADIPAGATFWRLQLQVFDPDGNTSQGFVASSNLTSTSGTFQQTFCGSETPGTWTIRTTGFYQLLPAIPLGLPSSDTTFTVRRAATATQLSAYRTSKGRYKVRSFVQEEGPGGMFDPDGTDVQLQRLVDGAWKPVRRAVLTTDDGRATVRVRFPAGTRLRGITQGKGNYDGSTSAPITLRKR